MFNIPFLTILLFWYKFWLLFVDFSVCLPVSVLICYYFAPIDSLRSLCFSDGQKLQLRLVFFLPLFSSNFLSVYDEDDAANQEPQNRFHSTHRKYALKILFLIYILKKISVSVQDFKD